MIIQSQEELSQLLKENEELKRDATNRVLKENNMLNINNLQTVGNKQHTQMNLNLSNLPQSNNLVTSLTPRSNRSLREPNIVHLSEESQKINFEYLKNIMVKYLDALAVGNEFQIKILENVLFSMLKFSSSEKNKLEEKRLRSSFYYNLWYNARDYISAKIYGASNDDTNDENNQKNEEYKKEVYGMINN